MAGHAKRYPGVYAAMSTPLTAGGEIDGASIKRVVDNLLGGGIDGLSILGSTGECNGLRHPQRRQALEATLEAVNGRATVFTGAAGTVVDDIIADLKAAGGTGAAGALVPPPFYFPLSTAAVIDYYERVAEASPVPIILYNIPRMTKVPIAVEAVARLAAHPNIAGIKDSSGEFGYFCEVVRATAPYQGFTVLTGSDALLAPSLYVGGHGIIGAGANIVPDLEAQVFAAFQAGDHAKALAVQAKVADAVSACRVGVFPAGYKGALALKGLCERWMTPPVPPLTDAELVELRRRLVEAGVLS